MKKYILFDNDGVLVETEMWYHRANVEILKLMNIDISEQRYKEIMIKGQSALMLATEQGYDDETVENYRVKRNKLYQHYIKTEDIKIDGVEKVLANLNKKYKMGIITSARRQDFELIHKDKKLTKYMQFALCSGEYTRSKPYPDPYLEGLELFKGKKEEAIVVEDSQRGLESAFNADIECVIVHNDFTATHDFTNATHRIKSLQELESLL